MKYEGLLPIGSVVKLKEAEPDLMITGYCVRRENDPDSLFDYCACPHPSGLSGPDQNLFFNHNQIEQIRSVGYLSSASFVLIPRVEEILAELRKKLSEAKTEKGPET